MYLTSRQYHLLSSIARALTLNSIPLHAILRSDLSKVRLDDRSIATSSEKSLIRCNTEVFLATGSELDIDTVGSASGVSCFAGSGSRRCGWCRSTGGCDEGCRSGGRGRSYNCGAWDALGVILWRVSSLGVLGLARHREIRVVWIY